MTTFWDILGVTIHLLRFLVDEGAMDYERVNLTTRHRYYKALVNSGDDGVPDWVLSDVARSVHLPKPVDETIELRKYVVLMPSVKLSLYQLRIGIGHESRTVVYSDV